MNTQIAEQLDLYEMTRDMHWVIKPCCALDGTGVEVSTCYVDTSPPTVVQHTTFYNRML